MRTRGGAELDPDAVAVAVDGRDVSAECDVRVPALHPSTRADYRYRPHGGWGAGRHEVAVGPGADGDSARWSFVVDPGRNIPTQAARAR